MQDGVVVQLGRKSREAIFGKHLLFYYLITFFCVKEFSVHLLSLDSDNYYAKGILKQLINLLFWKGYALMLMYFSFFL